MPISVDDVVRVASADDLRTDDPYDIWKTRIGFWCKNLFNRHRLLGIAPAAALELFDLFVNDRIRWLYSPQEYPIVRAWAALCLLNIYRRDRNAAVLASVTRHLDWLVANAVKTTHGLGWGLAFRYAVDKNMVYEPHAVFSTMSLYAIEAFDDFSALTGDQRYLPTVHAALTFYYRDLPIMSRTDRWIATAYTNSPDRIVTNAIAYNMYAHAKMLQHRTADESALVDRIQRLYQFLVEHQRHEGSWLYSPSARSFVDGFHSCIIIKNIIKTDAILALSSGKQVAQKGYNFLKRSLLDQRTGLYRRFAVSNKPSLIAFDLYDNAEMLSLSVDMGDSAETARLHQRISAAFEQEKSVWSKISIFGTRHNMNTLRWAVMPYFHALTRVWITRPG